MVDQELKNKRALYRCKNNFTTLDQVELYEEYAKAHNLNNDEKQQKYTYNGDFNKKLSLWSGDSTAIEVDAIVNAANETLMGGGGIDGAIHRAAGKDLQKECATLKGCDTGSTKITKGYLLPAKHVLHTVGPVGEKPDLLRSCYESCLNLMLENNLKSVVFCCISTGIFGYPLKNAAHVALDTVRKWMETNDNHTKIDRIIFVTFLKKEVDTYNELMPLYFPLPPNNAEDKVEDEEEDNEDNTETNE
ncbi:O-acetyl-ADP-ribose deacetylase [Acrasis kona]|uniref:O-acetyl-ADP-ribose deacetylase n=1 Tax=Acrasis kona TaxID=1008807 RepID=A0AAW2Z6J1_9EUKA